MADTFILLTGATGFVGFRTLVFVLQAGHRVRIAVRSEAKAHAVLTNPALPKLTTDQLTYTIVPDFTAPHAFDSAVKNTTHIIHIASPSPFAMTASSELTALMLEPAILGTHAIFEAAQRSPTVKRIVVTSSVAAIVSLETFMGAPQATILTPEIRQTEIPAPYPNELAAYVASKIAALNRAEAWVKEHNPNFDAIHICPTFVLGRDDTTTTLAGFDTNTNSMVLQPVLGKTAPVRPGAVVHIDDVALAHVRALDPKVQGNQTFLCTSDESEAMAWDDANGYARKHFPEAVEKGLLPCDGSVETVGFRADVSKTERELGVVFRGYEEMTRSVVGQYLEILEAGKECA